ncbi:hypothetical protein Ga0080574_TMP3319 [Salipiger abyssi]|uniref:Uncharacterized protein n=1 Tax=Salipiger abyssi TaxID=1250539 RepID=A0A1P8UW78_9RHOB|nr:hypothetical protein Ga0080574_TMP3319 [Salipiger abyssi]
MNSSVFSGAMKNVTEDARNGAVSSAPEQYETVFLDLE